METKPTQQELKNMTIEFVQHTHKKVRNVLLHRQEIVSKLLKDSTDEEISYIKQEIINPKTYMDALNLCLWNGDIDDDYYKLFIGLIDIGVLAENRLNNYFDSILKNA